MDIRQYESVFLEESKDNLSRMNHLLITLENTKSVKGEVDELFRIAHTLKGMCSTMGFEIMTKVTHMLEDKLEKVKKEKIITDELLEILFESLDILESQVDEIIESGKEKDIDISKIFNEKKEETKKDKKEWINEEERERILKMNYELEKEGLSLYEISVKVSKESMLKAARAFMVFKNLEEVGEVLHVYPPVEEMEDGLFEDDIKFVVCSNLEKVMISEKIKNISEIEDVEINDFGKDNKINKNEKSEIKKDITSEIEKIQEVKEAQEERKVKKTVRVDIEKLDHLMNTVSELIIIKTRMEQEKRSLIEIGLLDAVESLERITTSIHDSVTQIRMVPINGVFNRFPRMVRDISKELEKDINLVIEGEDTEIDRGMIDEVADPLIHIIRNSLDHGIERPREREDKGKSGQGTLKIGAFQEGNSVIIEISDDGAGINSEKVKKKAIEKGLITSEEANSINESGIFNLIMLPGFSTAESVSNISGRGVGLDAVKEKIESLGGSIEIISIKDKGTTFQIRLPLTLSIIHALMIEEKDEKFAIPLATISEVIRIKEDTIKEIGKDEAIIHRDKTLKIIRLSNVFGLGKEKGDYANLVIVRKGDRQIAISVEKLIGNQEIVVKSLSENSKNLKEVSGATILGNGSLALILDSSAFFD